MSSCKGQRRFTLNQYILLLAAIFVSTFGTIEGHSISRNYHSFGLNVSPFRGLVSATLPLPSSQTTSSRYSYSSSCRRSSSRNWGQNRPPTSGRYSHYPVAMTVDGGIVSETFFGGLHNFLQIYNFVLTARILLSWFPQFAQQPFFQPLFTITNPFFNIFRGIIPPIGGLDLSPLPAFFLLFFLSNGILSLSMEPSTNSKLPTKKQFYDQNNRTRRRKRGQKNQESALKCQSNGNYSNKLQRYLRTKRLAVPVSFVIPPVQMKKVW